MSHSRIARIRKRAAAALLYLQLNGPATVSEVSDGIKQKSTRTRYALSTLSQDGHAHIHDYERVVGLDGIPRYLVIYAEGQGTGERIHYDPSMVLDWVTGAHLQETYMHWSATRTPDYIYDETLVRI